MEKKKFLMLFVILAVVLALAVGLYRNLSGLSSPIPPAAAPADPRPATDFTVYDLDGNEVHLSDFAGKPIVLNFWASSCGPCRSEMPDFQTAYEVLGEDVQFVMVNVTDGQWDTLDTASAYIADSGFTFPVYYDTTVEAAVTYGVRGLPTTVFINAEGNYIAQRSGAMSYDILMGGIDLIYHP